MQKLQFEYSACDIAENFQEGFNEKGVSERKWFWDNSTPTIIM